MTATALREKIHGCIDELDEEHLVTVFDFLKDLMLAERVILEKPATSFKSDKVKGFKLEKGDSNLLSKNQK